MAKLGQDTISIHSTHWFNTGYEKDQTQKSELGQFMTPDKVARFMASLFPSERLHTCRLLDAGLLAQNPEK